MHATAQFLCRFSQDKLAKHDIATIEIERIESMESPGQIVAFLILFIAGIVFASEYKEAKARRQYKKFRKQINKLEKELITLQKELNIERDRVAEIETIEQGLNASRKNFEKLKKNYTALEQKYNKVKEMTKYLYDQANRKDNKKILFARIVRDEIEKRFPSPADIQAKKEQDAKNAFKRINDGM